MKNVSFWVALCCGVALSGSAALAQAVPDCDCDGISDATEMAPCIAQCCSLLGGCPPNQAFCDAGCFDKLDCNSQLSAGFCCDGATGDETALCDGWACTNDSCSIDTFGDAEKGDPTKDCTVDRGHGTVVNDESDQYCNQAKDLYACAKVNGQGGEACGDKLNKDCPDRCSDTGVLCPAGTCVNVCEGSKTECKTDSDCVGLPEQPPCVPQTCVDPDCEDPNICDFWTCNPGQFSNAAGCYLNFVPVSQALACGNPATDDCDAEDICDGKGGCPDTKQPPNTACTITGKPFPNPDPDEMCDDADKCGGDKDTGVGNGICENRVLPAPDPDADPPVVGTVCRPSFNATVCDPAEYCDGASKLCPADFWEPAGAICGKELATGEDVNETNICDAADVCDGTKESECPNLVQPDTVECRPVVTGKDAQCDVAETCQGGTDKTCPVDGFNPPATVCDADQDQCTLDECTSAGVCDFVGNRDCNDDNCCTTDFCDQDDPRAKKSGDCKTAAANCGCVNTYEGAVNLTCSPPCGNIMCRTHISHDGSATNTYPANDFPDNDDARNKKCDPDNRGSVLQDSCFNAEIYCVDGSKEQLGLGCVFVDLDIGDDECPAAIEDANGNGDESAIIVNSKLFPHFQDGVNIDKSYTVQDVGGCVNTGGVGVDSWAKLATIKMRAPKMECKGFAALDTALKASSLFGGQDKKDPTFPKKDPKPFDVLCWGSIFELDGDECGTQINAGDWGMFASCWLTKDEPGNQPGSNLCADADFDLDGFVGPGDFNAFATAWQKQVCGGGIMVPAEQMHCGGGGSFMMMNDDGSTTDVEIPWATRRDVEGIGLTYPPPLAVEGVRTLWERGARW
jgi:hypothetical protein